MSDQFLAPAPDSRIGQILQDRYRIVRKLGEGGMGAVYEGEHTVIKRKVAIKCLHSQFASDPEMVARFHREAMAANAIRHPNIVEVTDMGRFADGAVFMVLEFLEGRELSAILKQEGALVLGRAVHIVSQVCDALSAAHDQGIVHRDLKPDNIYLCPRGDDADFVKVLDFGIAKFRETGQGQGITRTGHTMGTPHYMAPEQAQAKKDLDQRADIYSLGVILFHAITGTLPFDDESFPMLMIKVVQSPAPRLKQIAPGVPDAIDDLVHRMLGKDPNGRPSSCREVKAALAPFAEEPTIHPAVAAPSESPTQHGFYQTPKGKQASSHGATTVLEATGPIDDPRPPIEPPSQPSMQTELPRSSLSTWAIVAGALLLLIGGGGAFALAYSGFGTEPQRGTATDVASPPPDDRRPEIAREVEEPEVIVREEPREEPPVRAQIDPPEADEVDQRVDRGAVGRAHIRPRITPLETNTPSNPPNAPEGRPPQNPDGRRGDGFIDTRGRI